MILTSTGAVTPYTPPWMRDETGKPKPGAPVLHLRAGSVIERGEMEAELAGPYRAAEVYGFELRTAVRSGVLTLLAEDPELDRLLGLIEAEADGDAAELEEDDKQLLSGVRKILAEHWPEYRDLVAQIERRRAIAPIVAFRRYCVEAQIEGVTFERGKDGFVTEATLAQVEPFLLTLAGNYAYSLQRPRGLEGNLPRPSPSDDSRKPSSSAARSKAGGKSATSAGKRTRASSSRRGSGQS